MSVIFFDFFCPASTESYNSWEDEKSCDCAYAIEQFRAASNGGQWEVVKVMDERQAEDGKKEYLLRWKGCEASDDSWVPEDRTSCPELMRPF